MHMQLNCIAGAFALPPGDTGLSVCATDMWSSEGVFRALAFVYLLFVALPCLPSAIGVGVVLLLLIDSTY